MSTCTARSPCLFLLPLSMSVGVSDGHPRLWRLFFCLFGRKSSASKGRGGSSPGVLWGELWFASEGVSVLGRRCRVAAAQGDQQRRCIVPGNPLVGLQRRLRASCVWVEVDLKQIWLWGQKTDFYYASFLVFLKWHRPNILTFRGTVIEIGSTFLSWSL